MAEGGAFSPMRARRGSNEVATDALLKLILDRISPLDFTSKLVPAKRHNVPRGFGVGIGRWHRAGQQSPDKRRDLRSDGPEITDPPELAGERYQISTTRDNPGIPQAEPATRSDGMALL
jgi:hypothetical protein